MNTDSIRLTIIIAISIFSLYGCKNQSTNTTEDQIAPSSNIEVSSTQFKLGKMKLGSLSTQPFKKTIKLNGIIDIPPEHTTTVCAYFGGFVKHISLIEGSRVSKGQTLFTIENPAFIETQQAFLESKSQLKYLKSDYERQKTLSLKEINAEKTLLKSETEYKMELVKYEALKKKLQMMNINPSGITVQNIRATVVVKAPITGFISSISINKGTFLNPTDVALTIINPNHMHVELRLFEKELHKIKKGQEVLIKTSELSSSFKAEVFLINRNINPKDRSSKAHCHFKDNTAAQQLSPGMLVEAEVILNKDSVLALPKDAVVQVENKHYILILINKDGQNNTKFKKVEVELGKTNAGYIEIKNALSFNPNEAILTHGAYYLIQ